MGHSITPLRTPVVYLPDRTTWPDPRHETKVWRAVELARMADAYGETQPDRDTRTAYRRLARAYAKAAIRFAPSSALRAMYAAWYRDYHYKLIWGM